MIVAALNQQVWWYASRSSGIIAWVLITLSIMWGLFLSTRVLGNNPAPAWLLDLHRYLGGLAVAFTAIHLIGLVADSYVHFGWAEIFVPMASSWQPGAVAWGIVAFYVLVAIELTSLMMRRLSRRLWRLVHHLSWILFVFATVHGLTAGTDVQNPLYRWTALASVQGVFFLTIVRILAQRKARRRAKPSPRVAVRVG
ncbi:MAG: ferric reductase-like transmembrane domain-containing protein [Acidimicrobiales bacterium]